MGGGVVSIFPSTLPSSHLHLHLVNTTLQHHTKRKAKRKEKESRNLRLHSHSHVGRLQAIGPTSSQVPHTSGFAQVAMRPFLQVMLNLSTMAMSAAAANAVSDMARMKRLDRMTTGLTMYVRK